MFLLDPRLDGGTVPGRGLRPARLLPRQPRVHGPPGQDQVRIPHHYGRGEKVTRHDRVLHAVLDFQLYIIYVLFMS